MPLFFLLLIIAILGQPIAHAQPLSDFDIWLEHLKNEALNEGISAPTLESALSGLTPNPKVIELDRRQPEFTQTYQDYISRRVSETRIARGHEKIRQHQAALNKVAQEYGVPGRFIAAIWGMETNYGSYTGGYSVIRSLATLAHDTRRPAFFRAQLIAALKIIDQGHITQDNMKGSWAGAMGQSQFMPSSFLDYAADNDGDGRKDIWTNETDVFASIANYLTRHGWRKGETWGREVRLPPDSEALWHKVKLKEQPKRCRRALKHHSQQLSLADWQALGVRRHDGGDLPIEAGNGIPASLILPAGLNGPAYLTYPNFRMILRYNCSNYYALGVSLLANELILKEDNNTQTP
ncbi:MAG: lytic transglycosylase [Kordiimonas sp.]|nr:lytic transglycosylase [Kordiimonas sp.]